jgi:hypothetical protein
MIFWRETYVIERKPTEGRVYVHTDKHEQDLIARIPCDGLLYNFILFSC